MNVEAMLRELRSLILKASFIGLILLTGIVSAFADDSVDDTASDLVNDLVAKQSAAKEVVDSLHNSLYAAAVSSGSFDERYKQIAPIVSESYDFTFISRFILRRSWSKLDASQRERFISVFERLSVATYVNRFAELKDQSIVITDAQPAAGKGDRVQVDTQIQVDDEEVMLSYTLKEGEGSWKIVNVVADGVSDLALRRAEYSRKLKEKGFDGLLDHIDGQIAKLR